MRSLSTRNATSINANALQAYTANIANAATPPSGVAARTATQAAGAGWAEKGAMGVLLVALLGYFGYAYLKTGKVSIEELDKKNIMPNVHNLLTITVAAILGIVLLKLGLTSLRVHLGQSKTKVANWIGHYIVSPIAKFVQLS